MNQAATIAKIACIQASISAPWNDDPEELQIQQKASEKTEIQTKKHVKRTMQIPVNEDNRRALIVWLQPKHCRTGLWQIKDPS